MTETETLTDGRVAIEILPEGEYDDETRFIAAVGKLATWFALNTHISHMGASYDYLAARWGKNAYRHMDAE